MLNNYQLVTVPLVYGKEPWESVGYFWLHRLYPEAESYEPFQQLYESAQGEWFWDMAGEGNGTIRLIDMQNYHWLDRIGFRFYFELAGDAVLFKLTWSGT